MFSKYNGVQQRYAASGPEPYITANCDANGMSNMKCVRGGLFAFAQELMTIESIAVDQDGYPLGDYDLVAAELVQGFRNARLTAMEVLTSIGICQKGQKQRGPNLSA